MQKKHVVTAAGKLCDLDNLMNEDSIRSWVDEEFKSNQDVIEDLRFA